MGPPGPDTLRVSNRTGFDVGDQISIDTGANQELRTVTAASGNGGSQQLIVDSPLTIVHAPGASVVDLSKPGTGLDFTPALVNAHDALSTVSSMGSGITFSPALSSAHTAGTVAMGVGTYVNDNGGQINFNNISSPDTYTGGLRGGFRFEAIELRTPGTITLSGAGLNFAAYRATPAEYEGWFISSDDQLNRMWYAGAYTAQMDMVPVGVNACFTKPVIFDGAKRDRAIWSGDLTVSDPVALLSLGSNAAPYVTGSIDAFMDIQQASGRLTSAVGFRGCGGFDYAVTYSNYSAIIAIQYYRYTGDTAYILNLLPNLEAATAYAASRLDTNGLIVTNDNDYWQTQQNGEVTEYNLAYYELLRDMIWLEGHVGTQAMLDQYTADAAALKDAMNTYLFNTGVNLYQHTDSEPDVYPLDANMNAIRLGVAPAGQVQHILDYFQAAWQPHGSEITQPSPSRTDPFGHTIEPLNNYWEMLARLQSNDAAGALDLMRRLWGLQVDPNSGYFTNTFWEFVLANGLPSRGFDSLAHAWGAGPTQILTEAVIGATAVDPGYEAFQVKPQPVDLEWAQGQVPTAFGPMTVKWAQNTGNGMFHLEVTAPADTGGEVWVPVGSALDAASVVLSGDPTLLRRDGEYDVYSVGAGTFEFLGGYIFPSTSVLDDFNRHNGKVGNDWALADSLLQYRIANHRLDVRVGGALIWKPDSFGANQEAFITLTNVAQHSPSEGLLLKSQAGNRMEAGVIIVVYDAHANAVRVSTLRRNRPAWTNYGNTPATFADGDQLGARVLSDGTVNVYNNGILIATVTLNEEDQAFFNDKGGRIGIWTFAARNAVLDNFGGGDVTLP